MKDKASKTEVEMQIEEYLKQHLKIWIEQRVNYDGYSNDKEIVTTVKLKLGEQTIDTNSAFLEIT